MKLHSDLREFVALLNSHGVEYLVVGGHAVAFHGHPRFTGDIDFLIAATPPNAARRTRIAGTLDELPVAYLDLESLLQNKRASGRPKDLADVDKLQRIQRERRD